jgi:hypothetical protein
MKLVAALATLLATAGSLSCSGPDAPSGDAGFGPTTTWGTGGSVGSGTGGSFGTGGYPGTGGPSWQGDGGREDSGGGGGGRGKNKNPDAAINAVCPPGAMTGAPCNVPSLTCVAPSGDGGAQQVCTCPRKGGWNCMR